MFVSRPLLVVALLALLVLGFAPVVAAGLPLAGEPGVLAELLDERTTGLLTKTLLLGLASSALAVLLGAPFGFLTARTDMPLAGFLRAAGLVPLILPPIILAMTWTILVPLRGPVMTALLLGVGTFPLVAMFTARAFERIDARREDAALLAGGLPAVLRMELPLVAPSIFAGACLAFVFAVNDFALPDYVSSVGKKFGVYASEVFTAAKITEAKASAFAISLPLVALSLVALAPALALRRRGAATVDGDFQRPAQLRLGSARLPALLFCLSLVTIGAVVPIARLAFEAGGGSRIWGSGDISRSAWTQGGGANQVAPNATQAPDPGSRSATTPPAGTAPVAGPEVSDAAQESVAVNAAAAAARAAAARQLGRDPAEIEPTPRPTNSAAAGAFDRNSPEAVAARAAAEEAASATDTDAERRGGIARYVQNLQSSFYRALELSRGSILASLLIALAAATLSLPIALVLGHAVARARGGRALEVLAVFPLAVPAILFGIGAIAAWNHGWSAGVYESRWLVVLLFVGRFLAFPVLTLSAAVAAVDRRLEESAALSGAGPARRLSTIVAPGVWPSLVGAWTMVFVLSVRELDSAILVPAANDTVMFRVFNAVHFGRDDFVAAMSLIVVFVLVLPGLLWSLFARRRMELLP